MPLRGTIVSDARTGLEWIIATFAIGFACLVAACVLI